MLLRADRRVLVRGRPETEENRKKSTDTRQLSARVDHSREPLAEKGDRALFFSNRSDVISLTKDLFEKLGQETRLGGRKERTASTANSAKDWYRRNGLGSIANSLFLALWTRGGCV